MSKVGASALRRTLFLVMSVYVQNSPPDEPICQFMDRKHAEGEPCRVYMMASANKFPGICHALQKKVLKLEQEADEIMMEKIAQLRANLGSLAGKASDRDIEGISFK